MNPTPEQRQLIREEELCNRWASVGCEVAQLVSSAPAQLPVRLRELRRLRDVVDFYLARVEAQLPELPPGHLPPVPIPPAPEKPRHGHRSASIYG
jgi:hypothetical protein